MFSGLLVELTKVVLVSTLWWSSTPNLTNVSDVLLRGKG
jgi:hypothetical protein